MDPSLTVYDNGFHCFGCGEHGDIIDFVMKIDGIDFKASLSKFSKMTGIKAPENMQIKKAISEFKTPSVFELAEAMQANTPVYYDRSKNYWVWTGSYYEMVDDTDIQIALREIVDSERRILGNQKNAIMDAIRITGRERKIREVPKAWLHTKNYVVNIATGKQITPSPEYLLTAPIPHNIGKNTDTPNIERLFTEWVGADKTQMLYEICAYCLLDDYPIHRLFLLFGRGRNGKGQFREIVTRLVGKSNCAATSIEGLINSRFETARLYKKKVAVIGETNFALLENTAIIKMLTGGDPIPAEFKNRNPFEFYNTAKLLINTNSLPPTTDKTDAFYSRFVIVSFPNQFPKGKDIVDTIPDDEYENLLAKCIPILRNLLEREEFTQEGTIQDKAIVYEALANPVSQFIELFCVKDINSTTASWRLFEKYTLFCKEKGFRELTQREFNKVLKSDYELEKKKIDGNNWVWVYGLRFKDDERTQKGDTILYKSGSKNTDSEGCFEPKEPKESDVQFSSLYREIDEKMGSTGSLGSLMDTTNDFENNLFSTCKEWESNHQEKINSTNLTKVCFDLKSMFPDTPMDDLADMIRKITKITLTNSNSNKPPLKKGKEIEIPFNDWSLDRLKAGKKTATSRNKKYGNPGDYFKVDGVEYVLTAITQKTLKEIAEQHYQAEGAESPDEFREIWNSIHMKKGFLPEQTVFYHEFAYISTNGNGSEDSDQKPPQHHCRDCGAVPAINVSESALGKKEYRCTQCYHQKYPFLSKESAKT